MSLFRQAKSGESSGGAPGLSRNVSNQSSAQIYQGMQWTSNRTSNPPLTAGPHQTKASRREALLQQPSQNRVTGAKKNESPSPVVAGGLKQLTINFGMSNKSTPTSKVPTEPSENQRLSEAQTAKTQQRLSAPSGVNLQQHRHSTSGQSTSNSTAKRDVPRSLQGGQAKQQIVYVPSRKPLISNPEKPKLFEAKKPSLLAEDELDVLLDNDDLDNQGLQDIVMCLDEDDTSGGRNAFIEISSNSLSIVPTQKPYDKTDAQILGLASPEGAIQVDIEVDDDQFMRTGGYPSLTTRQQPTVINLESDSMSDSRSKAGAPNFFSNKTGQRPQSMLMGRPAAAESFDYHAYQPPTRQDEKQAQLRSFLSDEANHDTFNQTYNSTTQMKNSSFNRNQQSSRQVTYTNPVGLNYGQNNIKPGQQYIDLSQQQPSYQQQPSAFSLNPYHSQTSNASGNKVSMDFFKQRQAQAQQQDELQLLSKYRPNAPPQPEKSSLAPDTDSFYRKQAESQYPSNQLIPKVTQEVKKHGPPLTALQSSSFNKQPADLGTKTKQAPPKAAEVVADTQYDEKKVTKMKERIHKQIYKNKNSSSLKNLAAAGFKNSSREFGEESFRDVKLLIQQQYPQYQAKQEAGKLQKESERQNNLKQAKEEERLRLQKEKDDVFKALFGDSTTPTEPSSKQTKVQPEEDALFKQLMEQMQKKREAQNADPQNGGEEEKRQIVPAVPRKTREQIEREEIERRFRYNTRKTVDELIQPILSLDIIELHADENLHFESVPNQFDSFEHYQSIWIPLFLFETYSQMISRRTEGEKDKELLQAQGVKINQNALKKKHFEGFIQRQETTKLYYELMLYESQRNAPDNFGNYNLGILDTLKEFDLLLITQEPLPVDEVKKITSIDYLMKLKKEKGKMLGVVSGKRKKDSPYIKVKVDRILHEDYVTLRVLLNDLLKVHIYFYDSLVTTVREFRTIKCCEFFPTANIILNPTLINQHNSKNTADSAFNKKLQSFIEKHQGKFNESQLQALDQVTKMKQEDFLLIQGPPGTGKTHTIQGIISMLVTAEVKRILICAPSNAAIDEIVLRIANMKLFGQVNEHELKDRLLRIGSMDYEPLPAVKKYTLDSKVREIMDGPAILAKAQEGSIQDLHNKLDAIKQCLQSIWTLRRITNNGTEDKEKNRIVDMIKILFKNDVQSQVRRFFSTPKDERLKHLEGLEKAYEKKQTEFQGELGKHEVQRHKPKNKRNDVEKQIILKAQIICTTLSMSAIERLDIIGKDDIEYLIIDEACQSVELNCLIPFEHEPKKVILVGDQQQLPATTFSENSDRTGYSKSLFERFLECGVNRFMLSIQYRMHPIIREFPSNQFYEGMLQDDPSVERDLSKQCFLTQELSNSIQNLVFFDLKHGQESNSDTSKSNMDEAHFIEALISDLIKILLQSKNLPQDVAHGSYSDKMDYIGKEFRGKIGIITPYKSQVRTLKDCIYPKLRNLKLSIDMVEINTVDAYQGREKEIIIISCVRGSQERTLGFLNDYRRMNVAITRAKNFLWVVGNSRTLTRNKNWEAFIKYCKGKSQPSPATGSPKSTKNSCYIQLSSRDQWKDHKLLNILLGREPLPKIEDDSEGSPQKQLDSPPQRHQKFEDNGLKKRLHHHRKHDEDQSEEGQIKSPQQHEQKSRKRDQKHREKRRHSRDRSPPPQQHHGQETKQKGNLRELLSEPPKKSHEAAQPNLPPKPKTAFDSLFDSVISNIPPSNKGPAPALQETQARQSPRKLQKPTQLPPKPPQNKPTEMDAIFKSLGF